MERLDFSPHDSCILTKSGYTDDITGIVNVEVLSTCTQGKSRKNSDGDMWRYLSLEACM